MNAIEMRPMESGTHLIAGDGVDQMAAGIANLIRDRDHGNDLAPNASAMRPHVEGPAMARVLHKTLHFPLLAGNWEGETRPYD